MPGGVGSFKFTPDGKRLLLTADVYPDCGADPACNKKIEEARGKSKLKAWVADRLLYRHWNEWRVPKRTHILVVDLAKDTFDAS